MSTTPTGKGKCDSCGQLEDNTALIYFVAVNDLDSTDGSVTILLYCRRNGCAQGLIPDSPTLVQTGVESKPASEEGATAPNRNSQRKKTGAKK